MKTIDNTYEVGAPVSKVWQALIDAKLIDQWGAGPAKFDATDGGKFSLWGGDINGTNTKVVANELLEQDWYGHDHPERCYKVSFSLSEKDGKTVIHLIHPDIPDEESADFEEGWDDYYFKPIKQLLED
jgi:activator of HSP90 ATPase